MKLLLTLAAAAASANAYWLMGIEDFITTERIDPVVNPGKVSGHAHSVLGGSNFRFATTTAQLRDSDCTSIPIPQDKSAYWFPHLYFQWNNGSFTSLNGGAVIYYLFSDTPGTTTAFPDDFRMISGDPTLRTYDPTSFAQQAVTFLCLDFNGVSTKHNELPSGSCPSGIRAQINFPSCWDGKNLDSPDHKSHVAFLSGGPDSGSCSDPKFPVVLPRIFMEVYWGSQDFDNVRSQARNTSQPFVYAHGDPTGYGYHADFINGWDKGVLQKAVDNCHCNEFGDATCCVNQGIFDMNQGKNCRITKAIDEQTTGTLLKLPGNNPVQPYGKKATIFTDNVTPPLISPIFAYTGDSPTATGSVVTPGQTQVQQASSVAATSVAATSAVVSTSVNVPPPPPASSASSVANPVTSVVSSIHVPTTTPVVSSQAPGNTPGHVSSVAGAPSASSAAPGHILTAASSVLASSAAASQATATVAATSIVPPATRPSTLPAQGGGLYGGSGPGSSSSSSSGNTSGSKGPGAGSSGSSSAPGNNSGSGMSSGSNPGSIADHGSSGHGTCSSKKKRRAMEQHRRRTFQQASHVRHLDYVYDTN